VLGSLWTLRNRSAAAVRNDGYAKGVISRLTANIIGTGIKPLCGVDDPVLRARAQELWLRWTDESDADGLLDFYGQQAQAVATWMTRGECFARLRPRLPSDGLTVPFQIQLLEPDLCPLDYTAVTAAGNRIRAGVEFGPIGQRLAYHFYRSRPGDVQDVDVSQLVRVPAESVVHLYDPLRPGQLRGIPILTQALTLLRDRDELSDATLLSQKLKNLFMAFLKRAGLPADETIDPLTGRAADADGNGLPMFGMEPGTVQELAPGEDMTFATPPGVPDTYESFMRQTLRAVGVATDVPYEILSGDLSAVNDRTARMILNEFRRRVEQWQHQIVVFQFCRPIWQAWWDRAVLAGALDVPAGYFDAPGEYASADWTPQRWPYLNPVQDVQARRDEIRAGLTSRRQAVSELGDDVERLDAENAEDNARADTLGLVYDSDARRTQQNGAAIATVTPPPSVPATNADGQMLLALATAAVTRPIAITVEGPKGPRPLQLVRDAAGRALGTRSWPDEQRPGDG
jgi:lambda family phage portal protein